MVEVSKRGVITSFSPRKVLHIILFYLIKFNIIIYIKKNYTLWVFSIIFIRFLHLNNSLDKIWMVLVFFQKKKGFPLFTPLFYSFLILILLSLC
jgi:hypothetical protein